MPPLPPPDQPQPPFFYAVSNEVIYNAVMGLQGQMSVLVHQGSQSAQQIVDHEARIRSLEKGRWPLPSLAVLVSLVSVILFIVRG